MFKKKSGVDQHSLNNSIKQTTNSIEDKKAGINKNIYFNISICLHIMYTM